MLPIKQATGSRMMMQSPKTIIEEALDEQSLPTTFPGSEPIKYQTAASTHCIVEKTARKMAFQRSRGVRFLTQSPATAKYAIIPATRLTSKL
mmetsp:Transcript_30953/g.38214  ORF Transcript_30953/g.38214 Transcript_30953/m.38214 type:complete len:92 (+) Transcript_30953:1390-1665(+)